METWGVSLVWGQVNSLVKRFAWGTRGRKTLSMVRCHSRYIYGTWRSKELGGGGGGGHKGGRAIFIGTEADPSRHRGLASLPELYPLILLFQFLLHL